MTAAEIAEVRARFNVGTETRADTRALLSHAETTPTIGESATAFIDGLNAGNFDVFFNNFRTNIMKSVLEGTVAGLFKSIAEDRLRPFAEAYRQALLTPGTGDDLSALADLRNGITMLSSDLKPVFDGLTPAFAGLKSELAANTSATQENTQALKEGEFGTTIASFNLPQPAAGLSLRNLLPSL